MIRLVRSEFLKIRTTNVWWLFAIGALALLALAFLVNAVNMHFALDLNGAGSDAEIDPEARRQLGALISPVAMTSYLVTSGQYFGLMFVLLIGIITVTNEFHHQTATATFLATPRRSSVIVAKAVAAALFGVGLWLVTAGMTIPATAVFMNAEGVTPALGEWPVARAVLLNLAAYALWALIGVGFGVLIRSQIGATVTALVLYLVGTTAVGIATAILAQWLEWDWILDAQYAVPSIASGLMVSGVTLPDQPPFWVGAVVLIAWAAVTGAAGTLITRTRDIS